MHTAARAFSGKVATVFPKKMPTKSIKLERFSIQRNREALQAANMASALPPVCPFFTPIADVGRDILNGSEVPRH
jgi:hypothetical protein